MSDGWKGPPEAAAAAPPASPCVGLCRIEGPGGFCAGCARSLDEIAAWSTMAAADRRKVWAALPGRRAALDRPPAPTDREPFHAP